MVEIIMSTLTEVVAAFGGVLKNVFESVSGVFYTPGTSGAAGSLTLVGTLSLVAAGVGLVYFGFKFIGSLIRARR